MERYDDIDRFKGLLILLVVLGHVLGAAQHICSSDAGHFFGWLFKFIYIFHMPAFFWIAGMMFNRKVSFKDFTFRKFRRLVVPFWVFGFLSACAYFIVGSGMLPSNSHYSNRMTLGIFSALGELAYGGAYRLNMVAFAYNSVLWFLPVMLSVELIYFGFQRLSSRLCLNDRKRIVILMTLIVFCIVLAWFTENKWSCACLPWGLRRVPYYMIYFGFGALIPVEKVRSFFCQKIFARIGGIGLFISLLAAAWWLPDLIMFVVKFWWYLAFVGLAIVGMVSAYAVACVVQSRLLAFCGQASLAIMLMHKPIVVFLQFSVHPIRQLYGKGICVGLLISFAITMLAVLFCLFADRCFKRIAPWALGYKRRI